MTRVTLTVEVENEDPVGFLEDLSGLVSQVDLIDGVKVLDTRYEQKPDWNAAFEKLFTGLKDAAQNKDTWADVADKVTGAVDHKVRDYFTAAGPNDAHNNRAWGSGQV